MKNKIKSKRKILIPVIVIAVIIISAVFVFLPKEQEISDSSYNLALLQDGIYQGECDNGLVYVKVSVEVKDFAIENVDIIEHRNGRGQDAEKITERVQQQQSVEVDAITGATASSQTILKAIENALSK